MAQPITPYPVAEESLLASSLAYGQEGMMSTSAPMGSNRLDSGAASKVEINSQPANNQRLAVQNVEQNTMSAAPQAGADAIQKVRAGGTAGSDAESKAQTYANERMAEMLFANDSGAAMMKLNGIMQSPDKAKFVNDIATGKTLRAGIDPDLAAQEAQAQQYG